MHAVDTDELLDYIICPHRFSFGSKPNRLDSVVGIKSQLYGRLFDYCLYLRASKQKVTPHKLNQRLNYLWSEVRAATTTNPTIAEKLSMSSRAVTIGNMFSSVNNVIYFDLPREVQVDGLSILYSFHTYTQNYITKTVVKFDRTHSGLSSSSSSLRILASLVKEDLKDLDDNLRHQVHLYRADTAELYKPELISKKELDSILKSIACGIKNKVHFPRNEIINCKNCLWKTQCSWNNLND